MDQHSFSTAFEKRLKPAVASDLGLSPCGQKFNVDYVTLDGNLVELKLRKFRENDGGQGFVMDKNQYGKIVKRYLNGGQTVQTIFDRNANCHCPNFSYLLLGYTSEKKVDSIRTVDEMLEDMTIYNAFLMDHRFIGEYDRSGKSSRFHRVLIEDLDKNIKNRKSVQLLGSRIDLKLVANGEYVEPCRVESYL